jgi:tetratricopeptide (TPR) repeat protein
MNNLAAAYHDTGKLELALPLYEETLRLRKATLGPDHPDTLSSMNNLAAAYRDADKLDMALPLFMEAAAGMEKRQFHHEYAGPIVNNLIGCHEQLGQFEQAESWRRKWLAVVKDRAGADSPAYAGALAALGLNLLQQHKWTDAEAVLRECLAIRQKQQPDVWTTFNTMSLLGAALLGRALAANDGVERATLLAEAEPLLVQGHEGMNQREHTIPAEAKTRIREALDRLVELYTALENPEEVQKYRERRAQIPKLQEKK